MIRTCSALVLRPTPFQEGGLVVSFLTEEGERVVGLAKGAKKPTAKWVSAFEPLGLVRVSLFGREHSELRRITRCELEQSPLTLGHLESSLVIACLAELFDRVAREGLEDARLFRLAAACARSLRQEPDRAPAILASAEFWLLRLLGLLPDARRCGVCGCSGAPLALLTWDRGWQCEGCAGLEPALALPPGVREQLETLRRHGPEGAPDPAGTPAAQATTALFRERLLQELGGRLGSYEVLRRMLP